MPMSSGDASPARGCPAAFPGSAVRWGRGLSLGLVWVATGLLAAPLPDTRAAMAALPPLRLPVSRRPSRQWPGQGDPEVERVRRCILQREAGGDYAAVDPSRRWYGAYQFARKTSDAAARRMKRPDLVGLTADRWPPEDQDAAFYVIYNRGRGKKHWEKGRYECF